MTATARLRTSGGDDPPDPPRVWDALCRHIDGMAIGTTIAALHERGALAMLAARDRTDFGPLRERLAANAGFLHVAMRLLADQGWVARSGEPGTDEMTIAPTQRGRVVMTQLAGAYPAAVRSLPVRVNRDPGPFGPLMRREWGLPASVPPDARHQVLAHLNGHLIAPVMYAVSSGEADVATSRGAAQILAAAGWARPEGGLTPDGEIAVSLAGQYRYPVMYLPLLRQVPELLFGEPGIGEPGRAPEATERNSAMRVVRAAAAAALLCAGLAACSSGGVASGSGSGSGSSASNSPVSAQVAATSQDVSFTVDGTKTYGTLEIPAHRGGQHLAAALLLAGSGPTDRNGDQPSQKVTPQTLKLVAEELARQGIMTLRFDKYFTGQTGAGAFASDPGNIDLNAYIRQADAAYAFLGAQPAADRQHLLVVGHSEGGFYAMLVADTASPHPAGLALLEPQDQRILSLVAVQLDEQLDSAVQQGQLSAPAAQQQAEGINNAIAQFRAGQQVDTSGLLPQIVQQLAPELLTPGNAKAARTNDEVSPVEAAAKVAAGTRVLITDGTADTNIPVSTINPLATALTGAGTTGPGLKVLTGVNHLLHMPGTQNNDPVLAPSVVAAITAWAQPFTTAG